jgi:hypothetical protein
MIMEKKRLLLTVLLMTALLAVAFAEDPRTDDVQEREDRKDFYKNIVLPAMRAQYDKLMSAMTSEDVDAAKKLGKEWRDNLLMMHELRCEVQAARIQLKPVEGSLMQEIEAQKIMLHSIIDRAEALAARYKGSIHLLMSEMRAEIRQKAIEQNYAKAMTPPPGSRRDVLFGRGPEGALPVSPEARFILLGSTKS